METQVSVRLPKSLPKEIDRRARRRKRARADIIRMALVTYLEFPEGAFGARPAERVRDLLGTLEGLPSDLATHAEAYLEGLGASR